MPQFEVHIDGDGRTYRGVVRGLDAADAVRRSLELESDRQVEVRDTDDLRAWKEVLVDGRACGRVRTHHRMRFRRD